MVRNIFLISILITSLRIDANSLLDDFENTNSKNKLGQDWFYFSDIKDDGNSEILNAVHISNGNYKPFMPDTPGCTSKHCGKVIFRIGDKNEWYNFVGIGTDVAPPGKSRDLRDMQGITFHCRGTDSLIVVLEIETGNVFDYGYYRTYIRLSKNWQICSFPFSDFAQPYDAGWPEQVELDISCVKKITWKVFGNRTGIINDDGGMSDEDVLVQQSGFFEIDDVYFVNDRTEKYLGQFNQTNSPSFLLHKRYTEVPHMVNLTGRVIPAHYKELPSGFYFWKIPEKYETLKSVSGIIFNGKTNR